MAKKKTEWLDSDGNLNPDVFWSDSEIDWSSMEIYETPDWVRHPERYPERMNRMEEFGKKWREGLSNARTTESS